MDLVNHFDKEDLVAKSVANIIPHAAAGAFTVRWPIGELILEGYTLEQVDTVVQQFDRVYTSLAETAYQLGYERASQEAVEKASAADPSPTKEEDRRSKPKKLHTGKGKK
jgi:hypothetical protein